MRQSRNRKKRGITRRKSRRGIPRAHLNSTPALHVSVYQRQADVRSCSVIKGTCNLTLVLLTCKVTLSGEAALSCFETPSDAPSRSVSATLYNVYFLEFGK